MTHVLRLLAVHGYQLEVKDGKPVLGPRAEAVCQKVAAIAGKYDHVVLLGGWHTAETGSGVTIADVMAERLVVMGLPRERIIFPLKAIEGVRWMPPRDTCEECVLLRSLLDSADLFHSEVEMVAGRAWLPRIEMIYNSLKITCHRWHGVHSPMTLGERVREFIARQVARRDPLGEDKYGKLFRDNRAQRTLCAPSKTAVPLLAPYG